jgi:hypothetical protein
MRSVRFWRSTNDVLMNFGLRLPFITAVVLLKTFAGL